MKDFLLYNYAFVNLAVVFIAAFSGLIVFKTYKETPVKYIIYFLFYVFITQVIGSYSSILYQLGFYHLIENTVFRFNFWWVTLTWYIGSAIFLTWYFKKIINSRFLKKILKYAVILFLIISIASIVVNLERFFGGTFKIIRIGNMSLIMIGAAFYLYELLQSPKVLEFYKDVHFYISIILIIWLLVTIPLVHFVCGEADTDPVQADLKWIIMVYANIFMYLAFAITLIVLKPKNDLLN